MSTLTPPARMVDPRGMRFGAAVSAIALVVAFVANLPWLAVLIGANLGISAAFGTRFFLPSRPWPFVRKVLHLRPVELEHEYPPRFAQAMGAAFLGIATVAFVLGMWPTAWLFAGIVAGLQTLLAATGICVGCRHYFVRWWVPSVFATLFRRSDSRRMDVPQIQRVG